MLVEIHPPPVAPPSDGQLALPLMPLVVPPPTAPPAPEVARPERVWSALPPMARARVRRAVVAVVQEVLGDRAGE
jgi:hypothetical protein